MNSGRKLIPTARLDFINITIISKCYYDTFIDTAIRVVRYGSLFERG
jgi:hypothetical protein